LKRFLLIQLITPFISLLYGQTPDPIEWTDNVRLEWSNYAYIETDLFLKEALTYSEIQVEKLLSNDDHTPTYKVIAQFYPSKSWTNDTSSNSLLRHERLHFDITELYARKMREIVERLKKEGISDFKLYSGELSKLYSECQVYQSKYDQETSSGLKEIEQQAWNEEISKMLKEFDRFSK